MNKILKSTQTFPNWPHTLTEAMVLRLFFVTWKIAQESARCSLLRFGSWVNWKVLTLDFEWFSSKVHCELDTKTVSKFPHSWFYFRKLSDTEFLRPLYDYEGLKQVILTSQYLSNAPSNLFEYVRICLFYGSFDLWEYELAEPMHRMGR